jgi:hypothetical protein
LPPLPIRRDRRDRIAASPLRRSWLRGGISSGSSRLLSRVRRWDNVYRHLVRRRIEWGRATRRLPEPLLPERRGEPHRSCFCVVVGARPHGWGGALVVRRRHLPQEGDRIRRETDAASMTNPAPAKLRRSARAVAGTRAPRCLAGSYKATAVRSPCLAMLNLPERSRWNSGLTAILGWYPQ